MVTITYFVHGTTTDNEQKLATGWLPGELSPLGIKQSHELAGQIAGQTSDVIISSDLKRAVQTAEIVFPGREVLRDERLREANYGDWNGAEHALFKTRLTDFIGSPFPGGESYKDVERRMRSLCQELLARYDGKRVALIAHQAPQLAIEVICNGKTWQTAIAEDWRTTGAFQPGWQYIVR